MWLCVTQPWFLAIDKVFKTIIDGNQMKCACCEIMGSLFDLSWK